MADDASRLLFRLQHILPRTFSICAAQSRQITQCSQSPTIEVLQHDESQEVEFQMTWGKIAGNLMIYVLLST